MQNETNVINNKYVFIHLRNRAKQAGGITVAMSKETGKIGFSICNKKDQFIKAKGRELAMKRAEMPISTDNRFTIDSQKKVNSSVKYFAKHYKIAIDNKDCAYIIWKNTIK